MKRFAFRLDRVLRIKQLRERLATAKVQQARLAFDAATQRVNELQKHLVATAAAAESAVGSACDGAAWVDRGGHAASLGRVLEVAQAEASQRAQALEQSLEARAEAAREVEVLLTLRRQLWHEHRQELLHEQQEFVDEYALRNWESDPSGHEPEA